ncbi:MAG: exosome complex RNA-binding protein Rrp4 [Methanobacterium sp.]|nr:exosome complex RNA-binding protein Rrp4 [Methanobacterium sp.]
MIFVEDKEIVIPGDILADEEYHSGRGTFKENNKICSSLVGLVAIRDKKISVIPLQSKYIPKRGDVVIGEITDIRFSMWNLDINSPYSGFLPASDVFGKEKKELNRTFDVGDVLFLRVVDVDEVKKVKLGLKGRELGKFRGGILINITPTKVPRLIGKKGSMINMIKDETRCEVIVGQNGVVWVKGEPSMERVAEKVINIIEEQAHTSGLTDRVRDMLAKFLGHEPEDTEPEENEAEEFEIIPIEIEGSDEIEESEETVEIEISEELGEVEESEKPDEIKEFKEE